MLVENLLAEKRRDEEKGRKEGIKEGITQTIKNMFNNGISIKDISKITNWDESKISKLVLKKN